MDNYKLGISRKYCVQCGHYKTFFEYILIQIHWLQCDYSNEGRLKIFRIKIVEVRNSVLTNDP